MATPFFSTTAMDTTRKRKWQDSAALTSNAPVLSGPIEQFSQVLEGVLKVMRRLRIRMGLVKRHRSIMKSVPQASFGGLPQELIDSICDNLGTSDIANIVIAFQICTDRTPAAAFTTCIFRKVIIHIDDDGVHPTTLHTLRTYAQCIKSVTVRAMGVNAVGEDIGRVLKLLEKVQMQSLFIPSGDKWSLPAQTLLGEFLDVHDGIMSLRIPDTYIRFPREQSLVLCWDTGVELAARNVRSSKLRHIVIQPTASKALAQKVIDNNRDVTVLRVFRKSTSYRIELPNYRNIITSLGIQWWNVKHLQFDSVNLFVRERDRGITKCLFNPKTLAISYCERAGEFLTWLATSNQTRSLTHLMMTTQAYPKGMTWAWNDRMSQDMEGVHDVLAKGGCALEFLQLDLNQWDKDNRQQACMENDVIPAIEAQTPSLRYLSLRWYGHEDVFLTGDDMGGKRGRTPGCTATTPYLTTLGPQKDAPRYEDQLIEAHIVDESCIPDLVCLGSENLLKCLHKRRRG
ncbi:hypothetical protein BDV96DRAFT_674696 [Lophiotrema nucula]|uniref:Uncharacterized protein n=1 Tax=Lophiotrema nucula TaxID=690887 RepID=A0A6A5ZQ56_9PLEO|nr:hypothetical protein BDV96DRAFT_674696 [Lophiotrema nucula]